MYPRSPFGVLVAVFLASFGMAMATIYTGHSDLPWWGLIVGLIISAIFLPFVVTVYAITGFAPDIQSLVQMLGAAMIPGSPQANMYFTLYGYNTLSQARGIIRDLEMVGLPLICCKRRRADAGRSDQGQYTKLPPRVTFWVQSVGAVVVSIHPSHHL